MDLESQWRNLEECFRGRPGTCSNQPPARVRGPGHTSDTSDLGGDTSRESGLGLGLQFCNRIPNRIPSLGSYRYRYLLEVGLGPNQTVFKVIQK